MPLFNPLLVGLIGILIGGLVNLLADDLPRRRAVQFPPRYPDGTARPPLAWLGITAFLFGKRASPNGVRLSWRYPLTELLTAGLMVMTVLATADDPRMTPLQLAFYLAYMVIFALVTVIDIEHKLILFVVIIPAWVVAIIDSLVTGVGANLPTALIGGAVGFGVFFLLYQGGFLFTYIMGKLRGYEIREVAFGYGDVMLMTFTGLILGWQPLPFAMFLTVILGAVGALLYLAGRAITGGRYSLFTALPYGPYIVAGTIIIMLFSTELFRR